MSSKNHVGSYWPSTVVTEFRYAMINAWDRTMSSALMHAGELYLERFGSKTPAQASAPDPTAASASNQAAAAANPANPGSLPVTQFGPSAPAASPRPADPGALLGAPIGPSAPSGVNLGSITDA